MIAATLFPLWPAEMRVGVYYLSVAAGCFVASILLLAVGKNMYFVKRKTKDICWYSITLKKKKTSKNIYYQSKAVKGYCYSGVMSGK